MTPPVQAARYHSPEALPYVPFGAPSGRERPVVLARGSVLGRTREIADRCARVVDLAGAGRLGTERSALKRAEVAICARRSSAAPLCLGGSGAVLHRGKASVDRQGAGRSRAIEVKQVSVPRYGRESNQRSQLGKRGDTSRGEQQRPILAGQRHRRPHANPPEWRRPRDALLRSPNWNHCQWGPCRRHGRRPHACLAGAFWARQQARWSAVNERWPRSGYRMQPQPSESQGRRRRPRRTDWRRGARRQRRPRRRGSRPVGRRRSRPSGT